MKVLFLQGSSHFLDERYDCTVFSYKKNKIKAPDISDAFLAQDYL